MLTFQRATGLSSKFTATGNICYITNSVNIQANCVKITDTKRHNMVDKVLFDPLLLKAISDFVPEAVVLDATCKAIQEIRAEYGRYKLCIEDDEITEMKWLIRRVRNFRRLLTVEIDEVKDNRVRTTGLCLSPRLQPKVERVLRLCSSLMTLQRSLGCFEFWVK